MIDSVYIVLTAIFFTLTWAFAGLCDRLSTSGQSGAVSKG